MRRSRGPQAVLALALLVGSVGCQTESPGFPLTATLRLQLVDNGLTFQQADPKGFQAATWVLDAATIHIDGFGDFDFLGSVPCVYTDNVLLADSLARSCSGTGLVLAANEPVVGQVRIVIRTMLLRTAIQPVLDPEVDLDGDRLANRTDNCPLIANPDQADVNADGDGDACSIVDPRTGALTLLDSDRDGFPDGIDNCNLVPNVDQADAIRGADLIGDACEEFSDVNLPGGPLTLTLPVNLRPAGPSFELLVVDINSRNAVRCDGARNGCKLLPDAIVLSNVGG